MGRCRWSIPARNILVLVAQTDLERQFAELKVDSSSLSKHAILSFGISLLFDGWAVMPNDISFY